MNALEKVTIFITRTRNGVTELLLFKHPNAGIQIPAGTVEIGETPLEAALREAKEETGLQEFENKTYIGLMKTSLPKDRFVVINRTKVFSRPDVTSFDWAQFRRGIWVNSCNRAEDEFFQVEYKEDDRYPNPNYVTYKIMGWVPKECLSQELVRHFYHFSFNSDTQAEWTQFTDNHNFKLFWAPISKLPNIVAPQNQWLEYIANELGYNLKSTTD
ncbi:NUDIX domain-containing protein [Clostridium sp. YIM B02515]|uniref:NUDIX domain-containing protein n=1 Tax=Clostridium rhizosphaerae TaxID=2803861 RepID=A0ABS1T4U0_9CLOT|nr:NUDIX domain-containing protein [Clostridium rhizosphaerae]MBL4934353.1 NUDIX domain-containing protein [Clostridium rhizosphaerae]